MDEYKALHRYTDDLKKGIFTNEEHNIEKAGKTESELMTLSVGGKHFTINQRLTKAIPNSLLQTLEKSSEYFNKAQKLYHFDRDPKLFSHILNAYREGEIHMPRNVCPVRFRREMNFWGIPQGLLAPCCWKLVYEVEADLETLDILLASKPSITSLDKVGTVTMVTNKNSETDDRPDNATSTHHKPWSLCTKIWLFLDEPTSSTAAKIWLFFYIFVVVVSAVVGILWLYPEVRVDPYLHSLLDDWEPEFDDNGTLIVLDISTYNSKVITMIFTDPHKALFAIDCFCILFFVLETLVHFLVCPKKSAYIKSMYNIIRIFLCVSMIISSVFEIRKDFIHNIHRGYAYFFFKSMNSLRLLLLFRLTKLYTGLQIICLAVQRSLKELVLLIFGLTIAVIIFGGLIFCMEIETDMFPNTYKSMWWALITMTTIGYGDFYPTSGLGYVIGFLCAINGLLIMALPVASIASNFSDLYDRNSDYQKFNASVREEKQKQFDQPAEIQDMDENKNKF